MDAVISERHIADYRIEIIIRKPGLLKPLRKYRRIRIELGRNPGCQRIKLDAGLMSALHRLGHESEEVADAHGGLQYLRALPEAKTIKAAPDCLYHCRRRK